MSAMITAIDLGISNIASLVKAFRSLGTELHVTRDGAAVRNAAKVILPGVGAFGAGMEALRKYRLDEPVRKAALERRIPFLGICLGMQLLANRSYEHGEHEGLGIVGGVVKPLDAAICKVVPHMGWNNLESIAGNPLLHGLSDKPDFYFVHSYHVVNLPQNVVVNVCDYHMPVVASIACKNVFGMQFHPEKSQRNGLIVLRNFLEYA
jgi:glutamine amidotransferase